MTVVAYLESTDPEMGAVRLCRGCGETWPRDDEFFYFNERGAVTGHCRACQYEYGMAYTAKHREAREQTRRDMAS